jgi:hypothetical protein
MLRARDVLTELQMPDLGRHGRRRDPTERAPEKVARVFSRVVPTRR